jgi:thioredoxin 1
MENFANVGYLEDKDFTGDTLDIKGLVIVFIFANWCSHCRNAHPQYQAFADSIKNDKNITVACIDTTGERQSEKNLAGIIKNIIPGFKGFPTICIFKNGKFVENLNGPRTKEGFYSFSKKHM